MKQVLLLLIAVLCCMSASAAEPDNTTFKSGDYYFRVLDETAKTAEIIANPNPDEGYCRTWSQCQVPPTVIYNDITYTVTSVGDSCFYNSGAVNVEPHIMVPATVVNVGKAAFVNGQGYGMQVSVPTSLETIGDMAFAHALITNNYIVIRNAKSIGRAAFYDTKAKYYTFLGNDLQSLPDSCFYGCKSLELVRIPSTVTSFGDRCFEGCSAFKLFYNEASVPQAVSEDLFALSDGKYAWQNPDAKLIVKDEAAKSAFEAADVWKNFTAETGDFRAVYLQKHYMYPTSTPFWYCDSTKLSYTKDGEPVDIPLLDGSEHEVTFTREMGSNALQSLHIINTMTSCIPELISDDQSAAVKGMSYTPARIKPYDSDEPIFSEAFREMIVLLANSARKMDGSFDVAEMTTNPTRGGIYLWNNFYFDEAYKQSGTIIINTPGRVSMSEQDGTEVTSLERGSSSNLVPVVHTGYPWVDNKAKYNGEASWTLTDENGAVIKEGKATLASDDSKPDNEQLNSLETIKNIIPYGKELRFYITFPDQSTDSCIINTYQRRSAILDTGGGLYTKFDIASEGEEDSQIKMEYFDLSANPDTVSLQWFPGRRATGRLAIVKPAYLTVDTLQVAPAVTGDVTVTDYYGNVQMTGEMNPTYQSVLVNVKKFVKFIDDELSLSDNVASSIIRLPGEYKYNYSFAIDGKPETAVGCSNTVVFTSAPLTTVSTDSTDVKADEMFTVEAYSMSGYPYNVADWQNKNDTVVAYIPDGNGGLKEIAKILIPLNAKDETAKLAYETSVTQEFCLKDANTDQIIFGKPKGDQIDTLLVVKEMTVPTGINEVPASKANVPNDGYYTIDGKYVGTNAALLPKGIYIQGRKKILVK